MELDPQAQQLNAQLQAANPTLLEMLAARGRAAFFPKMGVLAQSAEAQGMAINATIGVALEEDGRPMCLPSIARQISLPPEQVVSYTPSTGRPDVRRAWQALLLKKNPSLVGKSFSLPVATSALTHGLHLCGYLFGEAGRSLICPDLYWENYDTVFWQAHATRLDLFPMFNNRGGFNVEGLRAKLAASTARPTLVLLNFPNNPTGYTPTSAEAQEIAAALEQAAQRGPLVVLIDDAYFGLVYEPGVFNESIFTLLCDRHPNLLAIKLDGPTKEDYAWGLRVGFMTYGIQNGTPAVYAALESKTAGVIRGNISNISNLGQSLLSNAYAQPDYAAEKHAKYEALQRRYEKVKQILAAHPEYRREFVALPFNSGYFMCLKMTHADPERLRQKLLSDFSTGVIVMHNLVRLAFSSTSLDKLELLFHNIFQAAQAVSRSVAV